MTPVLERFLEYVRIDTQSCADSDTYPSTAKQLGFLNMLVEELLVLGASDVNIDEHGYVTARIPSNCTSSNNTSSNDTSSNGTQSAPPIAFIAHVDTSPDVSGASVSPRIIQYNGGDIEVAEGLTIPATQLTDYSGHNLVVADGSTLLGADDKAGVAEIMTAAERWLTDPSLPHGDVWLLFTPDEEIGRGVNHFDPSTFGAKYAYTVDGGAQGSLEWETFNAASAKIIIKGINYHPGYAKDKMINAQYLGAEIVRRVHELPRPETTTDRDGFFHLTSICGDVERCELGYIIRDHDRAEFERKKEVLRAIVAEVCGGEAAGEGEGEGESSIEIKDQYYNMGEVIRENFFMVDVAGEAMAEIGVEPKIYAVRGGTDGSRLSFMGLPCPNIFSGAENIHSRLEFVSEEVMNNAVDTVLKIAEIFCLKSLEK